MANEGLTREIAALYQLLGSDKLGRVSRTLDASVRDLLGALFARWDNDTANSGVVDGFVPSIPLPSTMNVYVTSGTAVARGSADATKFDESSLCLMQSRDGTLHVTLENGDALPRYDAVYLVPGASDQRTEQVQVFKLGVGPYEPQLHAQERRNTPSLLVCKGTPAGSPTRPVIPLPVGSYVRVTDVLVPAGAVDLSAATLYDSRSFVGRTGSLGHIEPWAAGSVTIFAGSVSIVSSYNVSSVTRVDVGKYTIVLSRLLDKETQLCFIGTPIMNDPTGAPSTGYYLRMHRQSYTTNIYVRMFDGTGNYADCSFFFRVDCIR
jgi:hypothetical protein